jgi:hypothetical protein
MVRELAKVKAIDPYSRMIGTEEWPFNPDPIWQDMQEWKRRYYRRRNDKGKFVKTKD